MNGEEKMCDIFATARDPSKVSKDFKFVNKKKVYYIILYIEYVLRPIYKPRRTKYLNR